MVTEVLSEIANGIGRLKQIKKEMSELEFKEALLDQRSLLLELKQAMLELKEENSRLKEEIIAVQKSDDRLAGTMIVTGFRYDRKEDSPVGMRYCQACEERDGKLYRLSRLNEHYASCPNCSKEFNAGMNGNVHGDWPEQSTVYRGD